eukprot:CAMPEP_0117445274 /NCGR_PEP_ID=MMETSP0759-20121206/5704_1 /TAXON_ID=63605 /ORGANISM="Percolomonas cosmopolitus, Strain WS" /LENGTH=1846 /DNA_ID=CAMNT_0005237431 /DNA_START=129 /DNA_END=5666 /DNA_ORIENTATION=+
MRPYRSSFYPATSTLSSSGPVLKSIHDVFVTSPEQTLKQRLDSIVSTGTAGIMQVYKDRLFFRNPQSSSLAIKGKQHLPSNGIYILLKDIQSTHDQQGGWFTNSSLTLVFRDLPQEHIITLQFRIEKDLDFVVQAIQSALKEYQHSKKRNRLEKLEPNQRFRLRHESSKKYLALSENNSNITLSHRDGLQEELFEWIYCDGMIFSKHLTSKVMEYNFQMDQIQLGDNKYHTGSNKYQIWRLSKGVLHLWNEFKALNATPNEDGVAVVSLSSTKDNKMEPQLWLLELSDRNPSLRIQTSRVVGKSHANLPPELKLDVPLYDSPLHSASMRDNGHDVDNGSINSTISNPPTLMVSDPNHQPLGSPSNAESSNRPPFKTQKSTSSITNRTDAGATPYTPASSVSSTPHSPRSHLHDDRMTQDSSGVPASPTPQTPVTDRSSSRRKRKHKSRHSRQSSNVSITQNSMTPSDIFTNVQFSEINQQRDDLKAENDSLNSKISALQKKLRHQHKHLDQLKKEHESQIEKLLQEHSIDMESLKEQLDQFRSQNQASQQSKFDQHDKLMEQLSVTNKTMAELKKKMMTRESQAKNLRHINQDLEKTVTSQRGALDQLQRESSNTQQELSESQTQLSQARKQLDFMQQQKMTAEKRIADLEKDASEWGPKLQSVTSDLKRAQDECKTTNKHLAQTREEAANHRQQSEEHCRELLLLRTELEKFRSEAKIRQMRLDSASQTEMSPQMLENNSLQQQLFREREIMEDERRVMLDEKKLLIKEEKELLEQQRQLKIGSNLKQHKQPSITQLQKALAQKEQELQSQTAHFSQRESQLFVGMDALEEESRQHKLEILDLKERHQILENQLKRAQTDSEVMRNRLLDREKELEILRETSDQALSNSTGAQTRFSKMRAQVEMDRRDLQREQEEIYRTQDNLRKEMYELQERYNQFDLHKRSFQVESKESLLKDKKDLQEREAEVTKKQKLLEKRDADLQQQWQVLQQEREEMTVLQQSLHDKQNHLLERESLLVKNLEAMSRGDAVFTSEKMEKAYAEIQHMGNDLEHARKEHARLSTDLEGRISAHTRYVEEMEFELAKRKTTLAEEYAEFEKEVAAFQEEKQQTLETAQRLQVKEDNLNDREQHLMRKVRNEENVRRKKLHADRIKLNEEIAQFEVHKESKKKELEENYQRFTDRAENMRAEIRQLEKIKRDHEQEIDAHKKSISEQQRRLGLLSEEAAQEQRELEQRLIQRQMDLDHEKNALETSKALFEKAGQDREAEFASKMELLVEKQSHINQMQEEHKSLHDSEKDRIAEDRLKLNREQAGVQAVRAALEEKSKEYEERTQLVSQWENKVAAREKQVTEKEKFVDAFLTRERHDAQIETMDCELNRDMNTKLESMKKEHREKIKQHEKMVREFERKHLQLLRELDEKHRQISEKEQALNESKKAFNANLRELTARQQGLASMERDFEEQKQLMIETREGYEHEHFLLQGEKERLAQAVGESTRLLLDLKQKEQDLDSRSELIALRDASLAKKQRYMLYAEENSINSLEEHMRQLEKEFEEKADHNRHVHDRDSLVNLEIEKENFRERLQKMNHAHELDLDVVRKQLNASVERNEQLEMQHAQLEYIVGKLIKDLNSEHEHYAELSSFLQQSHSVNESNGNFEPPAGERASMSPPSQQAPPIPVLNLNTLNSANASKTQRANQLSSEKKSTRESKLAISELEPQKSARSSQTHIVPPKSALYNNSPRISVHSADEKSEAINGTTAHQQDRLLSSHFKRDSATKYIPKGDIMSITLKSSPEQKWSVSIRDEGILSILQIDSVEEVGIEKHRYVFLAETLGRTVLELVKETKDGDLVQ